MKLALISVLAVPKHDLCLESIRAASGEISADRRGHVFSQQMAARRRAPLIIREVVIIIVVVVDEDISSSSSTSLPSERSGENVECLARTAAAERRKQ